MTSYNRCAWCSVGGSREFDAEYLLQRGLTIGSRAGQRLLTPWTNEKSLNNVHSYFCTSTLASECQVQIDDSIVSELWYRMLLWMLYTAPLADFETIFAHCVAHRVPTNARWFCSLVSNGRVFARMCCDRIKVGKYMRRIWARSKR